MIYLFAAWVIGWMSAFVIVLRRWLVELRAEVGQNATFGHIASVVLWAYVLTFLFWWGFFISEMRPEQPSSSTKGEG